MMQRSPDKLMEEQGQQNTCIHSYHTGKEFAECYKNHRPGYPEEVYTNIYNYHQKFGTGQFDVAVDAACGTGRSTMPLSQRFKKVIGIDVSEEQIAACPKDLPNVEFRVGIAEDLSFIPSTSVDLVTVGTAVHWLDWKKFCEEVKRILKPLGVLAVYTANYEKLDNFEAYQYMLQVRLDKFGQYAYTQSVLEVVMSNFHAVKMHGMEMVNRYDGMFIDKKWTLDTYIDYLKSFHFLTRYKEEHPDEDILSEIRTNLSKLLCGKVTPPPDLPVHGRVPAYEMIGRKPADAK